MTISPQDFLTSLRDSGVNFYVGVPDSLLKNLCACIDHSCDPSEHLISTNEGSAIGYGIGYYLATRKIPLIYMQNSGLGNCINPLLSLADNEVYGIPMVLLIGWRGEIDIHGIQIKDEPQHKKQGKITLDLLSSMGIHYSILNSNSDYKSQISEAVDLALQTSSPVAIVVRKNTFSEFSEGQISSTSAGEHSLSRESVIDQIVGVVGNNCPIISTTGMASRELYETRVKYGQSHASDFLTVGGMGHASQIAYAVSLAKPDNKVICIDGDGAFLMHAGSNALTADAPNIIHILINNKCHDSVGGQPTKGTILNFSEIVKTLGYKYSYICDNLAEFSSILKHSLQASGSTFIEVKCAKGHRKDLGRPKSTPSDNKKMFQAFLESK